MSPSLKPARRSSTKINCLAVDPCLIVQMRAGGTASRSNPAEDFANADNLADFHGDHGQMAIAGSKAVAVTDLHHVAIAALAAGNGDAAGGRCAHGLASSPRRSMPV